jgi:hypothetical protein
MSEIALSALAKIERVLPARLRSRVTAVQQTVTRCSTPETARGPTRET